MWDAEAGAFDDAADHGLRDPEVRRAWADLLLPLIDGRGRRVADLGCGTGTLSLLLAAEGGHFVSGVDFSSEMIHRAREKTKGTSPEPVFIVADAAEPPLTAGSFDVVLARHVLWAMPDPAAALKRWIELLGPDGVLQPGAEQPRGSPARIELADALVIDFEPAPAAVETGRGA